MGVLGLDSLVCESLKPVRLGFSFKAKTGRTVVLKLESPVESLVKPASRFGIQGRKILF
jgi:hypothetical protein